MKKTVKDLDDKELQEQLLRFKALYEKDKSHAPVIQTYKALIAEFKFRKAKPPEPPKDEVDGKVAEEKTGKKKAPRSTKSKKSISGKKSLKRPKISGSLKVAGTKAKRKSKFWLILIVALVVLAAAGGGAYYHFKIAPLI